MRQVILFILKQKSLLSLNSDLSHRLSALSQVIWWLKRCPHQLHLLQTWWLGSRSPLDTTLPGSTLGKSTLHSFVCSTCSRLLMHRSIISSNSINSRSSSKCASPHRCLSILDREGQIRCCRNRWWGARVCVVECLFLIIVVSLVTIWLNKMPF